jgi:ribonuclease HI
MKIEVYCDGSGNTFDSDGGYGYVLVVDGVVNKSGRGYLVSATNNVAEITAAIRGLQEAILYVGSLDVQLQSQVEVVLVSDSQLVLGYASGRYRCKALHLTQLYIELRRLYNQVKGSVRWVKGHSGDEHNETCDQLAKTARQGKGIGTTNLQSDKTVQDT